MAFKARENGKGRIRTPSQKGSGTSSSSQQIAGKADFSDPANSALVGAIAA